MQKLVESPSVSLVVPIYNEEGNITPLVASIVEACRSLSHEILLVDDGSSDGSKAELAAVAAGNPTVRVITLKRNFGQTAAMAAGIDNARGAVIIPMDGDGQNDPADIPRLLAKMDEGYDVVSGWRKDRHDKFLSRRLPSMLANGLISFVTGVHLHDYGCTLKAYKRDVITNLQLCGEMHRFLPAWCVWQGGRIAELAVNHRARTRGQSKYGIMRTFKVVIDLVTVKFFSGYISKPNYLFSGIGMGLVFISLLSGGVAVFDKIGPDMYPKLRLPLLLLAVFLGMVSVLFFMMGLMAELLVRLYFQVRSQKAYRLANE